VTAKARLGNRDHDSHAQNNCVRRPPARGPHPSRTPDHIPGSGIHARYLRRCPAFHAAFTSATARLAERPVPENPIATRRWCTTSARIRP